MSDETENVPVWGYVLGAFIGPIFGAPILVASAALKAFVLLKLWGWYLQSIFGGPRFSVAFGIALVGTFLTYQAHTQPVRKNAALQRAGDALLVPLYALFTGWIGTFIV